MMRKDITALEGKESMMYIDQEDESTVVISDLRAITSIISNKTKSKSH